MSIINKIHDKINEFYNENSDLIIKEFANNELFMKLSSSNVMTVLVQFLIDSNCEEEFGDIINEVSTKLFKNKDIMEALESTNSLYLSGLVLMSIGLSFTNMDEFADETVMEAIEKDELQPNDLDILEKSKVSLIKDKTIEMMKEYIKKKYTKKSPEIYIEEYNKGIITAEDIADLIFDGELSLYEFLNAADNDTLIDVTHDLKHSNDKKIKKQKNKNLKERVLSGKASFDDAMSFLKECDFKYFDEVFFLYKDQMVENLL